MAKSKAADGYSSEFDTVVTNLAGTEVCRHRASSAMRVADIKSEVEKLRGLPAHSQRLVAGGIVLSDGESLKDYCDSDSKLALMLILLPENLTLWLDHLGSTPRCIIASVFRELEPDIQECFECALCVVQKDGLALEFTSQELRNDKRIVFAAASQNGASLQFASETLRSDREVVRAALESCGLALQHVPLRFREERDMVDIALWQDMAAIEFVDRGLRYNVRFRLFYLWVWLCSRRLWLQSKEGKRNLAILSSCCFVSFMIMMSTGLGLFLIQPTKE